MSAPAAVTRVGDDLLVRPLHGTLPEMRTLGATWDRKTSSWRLAAARANAAAIRDLLPGVVVPDVVAAVVPVEDDRLYEHQRHAIGVLVAAPRGQIVVVPPGLGKTAVAVIAADRVGADQVVVVSPAPLLRTWEREIRRWGSGDVSTAIVHGGEPDWDVVRASRWIVTSWDIVARHQDWFAGRWPLWVLDESVLAKSRRSQRSMGLRGGTRRARRKADGTVVPAKSWENLRAGIDRLWLLSGSPTTKYADDLWAQLNMIWPRAFRSYWRFAERYCVLEDNMWSPTGKTVVASRRDRDVVEENSDLVTVVNPDIDLPDYLPEVVDVDLTKKQRVAYDSMTRDFVAELDSGVAMVAANRMAQLQKLQQIASYWDGASSKHDVLVDLIKAGAYEPPYLVWTHWREGAEALAERLDAIGLSVAHVRGGMSAKVKDSLIEDYKRGATDALVLSLQVGKFGHTLTNTRTIAYVDKTWNADDYFQSLFRVKRIGLKHRPLLVTLRAPGTVDELVELNLEPKVEGIARVTDSDLSELIRGLGRDAGPPIA